MKIMIVCMIFIAHLGEPRSVIGVGIATILVLLIVALAVFAGAISVVCIKR